MRFASLSVSNFRAIRDFSIEELSDFVLIAGPNGCGKSCVLDAMRLLKSMYGGYEPHELDQWFGEFQIDLSDREQLFQLLRNPDRPLVVSAGVQLSNREKEYISENVEELLAPVIWGQVLGSARGVASSNPIALEIQYPQHVEAVKGAIGRNAAKVLDELSQDKFELKVVISRNSPIEVRPNSVMGLVFRTYKPEHVGVLEFHSASRAYQREALGGVDLNIRNIANQRRSYTLYNWQQKYQNVKTELATMYFRDLVRREAGEFPAGDGELNVVMADMFQIFFPDKEYMGVRPDPSGSLSFPVRLQTGETHDLNELSSGEKEVVYGYLRIRSANAHDSTLLLDEPELHLNPGLLQGFSDFYFRHLGVARGNQLWLVTHSDTLLRQAVGNARYSVIHMTSATSQEEGNQATAVIAEDDLDRALIDLVGDLAMYQPRGKVVIFEGGGDTNFDVELTKRLFPEIAKKLNLLPGGYKQRVLDLYDVLATSAVETGDARRFYAIVDKDADTEPAPETNANVLKWDVYHIENYLLESHFVRSATRNLAGRDLFNSDERVLEALRECARDVMPAIRVDFLRKNINRQLVGSINLGGRPDGADPVAALLPSVEKTFERLDLAAERLRGRESLVQLDEENLIKLEAALEDGSWTKIFPGRSVLARYVGKYVRDLASYEGFRNVIIERMVDGGHEPAGMKEILRQVLDG